MNTVVVRFGVDGTRIYTVGDCRVLYVDEREEQKRAGYMGEKMTATELTGMLVSALWGEAVTTKTEHPVEDGTSSF